eukprot:scaffold6523_cov187-Alexandrium_tamarense.AAC.6
MQVPLESGAKDALVAPTNEERCFGGLRGENIAVCLSTTTSSHQRPTDSSAGTAQNTASQRKLIHQIRLASLVNKKISLIADRTLSDVAENITHHITSTRRTPLWLVYLCISCINRSIPI